MILIRLFVINLSKRVNFHFFYDDETKVVLENESLTPEPTGRVLWFIRNNWFFNNLNL